MSTKQHIIFDLDGTLIDSKPEIISTYKKVFEEIVPPHVIEYEEINYGNTLTAILEKVYNQSLKSKKIYIYNAGGDNILLQVS
jgi:phosphoglycolate phosphatase-like HAD superfamily hydrolase